MPLAFYCKNLHISLCYCFLENCMTGFARVNPFVWPLPLVKNNTLISQRHMYLSQYCSSLIINLSNSCTIFYASLIQHFQTLFPMTLSSMPLHLVGSVAVPRPFLNFFLVFFPWSTFTGTGNRINGSCTILAIFICYMLLVMNMYHWHDQSEINK